LGENPETNVESILVNLVQTGIQYPIKSVEEFSLCIILLLANIYFTKTKIFSVNRESPRIANIYLPTPKMKSNKLLRKGR